MLPPSPQNDHAASASDQPAAAMLIPPPSTSPLQRFGHRANAWFVTMLTIGMVLLPVAEILLRRLRGQGVPGGSVYVQHLTLWLGFVGALAATLGGRHLGLATGALLPKRTQNAAAILCDVVAAAVSMFLCAAAVQVIAANRSGDDMLAGGIPAWWSEAIVPVTLGLISLAFLWRTPGRWVGRITGLLICGGLAIAFTHHPAIMQSLFLPLMLVIGVAFLVGAPVFIAMSGAAMLLFFHAGEPIAAVPTETMRLVQNPTLPAIPLLTMVGYVLASGGASTRLVRAYKSLFGWLPGGVGLMVVSVCALFTTFTGGSGVTILALGGVLLPALIKDKYPQGFSLGLVTAAGSLGLLFPPSLPVVLYGAVAELAPDKLYLAGLVPGLLLVLVVMAYAVFTGVRAQAPRQSFSGKEVGAALWSAKFDLGLPVVVIGVYASGLATIVEAAALGGFYALCVELFAFSDIHPTRVLPEVMLQSATLVGAVVILLGVALGFSSYLVDAQIPDALVAWVQTHIHSQWAFLLALNGILLVLGSVFEIYASIIVLAPLIAPLGAIFHVDPLHLGVVFLANLELGFLFPPMGINLLLSASRFNVPLPTMYRHIWPFLLILAGGVLAITYIPAMTSGVVALLAH